MSDYVELHCHSNLSLLDGASSPEELARRAAELGMSALALTDHDAVYGAVPFAQAAQAYGIKPILGAELTLATGHHLTLLVEDEDGWANLCWLISRARRNAPKGAAVLPVADLPEHLEGLFVLSGCRRGEIASALLRKDRGTALRVAKEYRDLCGPGRFWVELQHHLLADDDRLVAELAALARHLQIGCVATNDVHYAQRERRPLQDILVCVRHRTSIYEAAALLRPNSEFYLKPHERLAPLFAECPDALCNTIQLAARCQFELRYGLQDLPQFPTPRGLDSMSYLRHLCERAIAARYPEGAEVPRRQMQYELGVIERAGLCNYFLIIWDIVRFARDNGILCQGRGSAANSLVAYLLNITPIDPLAHDLVFERFLSDERRIVPDIDIDFAADRREEVIQYVYRRYGPEHVAMACTFVTYRRRSAARDVAKALSVPPEQAPEVAIELSEVLQGFTRHLGIHNGGLVVTGSPLSTRVPTEPATMPGRVVVQWDKDALETVGLVKIDILGLRMLSAIAEALCIIEATTGERPDLDHLAFDDPEVYEMIGGADTIGLFQVESRAQAQLQPQFRPRSFADIVIAISLVRPGPLQGDMVHPYLRRRKGLEPVTYAHPALEPALSETLGVIVFQEQVLKVARDVAGFTPGQGEQLRRALGHKNYQERIEAFREDFLRGAMARGLSAEVAEEIFGQVRGFGGYSFSKAHAAAFSVLVYQSAWLKRYHPAAFFAALLNNQPMGFWPPAILVRDARRHGVEVLPVDIHRSKAGCTVEGRDILLGLRYVRHMGEASVARLLEARCQGRFRNLRDFCKRTRLAKCIVENLIVVGAMDGWGIRRRQLLWELGRLRYPEEELDLVFPEEEIVLPDVTRAERLSAEYEVLGLSTEDHIMALYRPALERHGILSSRDLEGCRDRSIVRVAGWAVIHQAPPTAKGHHFITLEDEHGLVNVIVRPDVYEVYQHTWNASPLLLVEGEVQHRNGVVNLLAQKARALSIGRHN